MKENTYRTRAYRLMRKNYIEKKCVACGETQKKIHVHHIDKNITNNNLSNLIYLCPKCHLSLHRKDGDMRLKNKNESEDRKKRKRNLYLKTDPNFGKTMSYPNRDGLALEKITIRLTEKDKIKIVKSAEKEKMSLTYYVLKKCL